MTHIVTLSQPQRIVFGDDCGPHCADYLEQRNLRHILVVTCPTVLKSLDPFLANIRARAETVLVHSRINSEPTIAMFEEALAVARSASLDTVIGIGGGSAMDVAKLAAALAGG